MGTPIRKETFKSRVRGLLIDNVVTILFIIICILGVVFSKQSAAYIMSEVNTRLSRNLVLILSLLVPVWAGLGLNFSIVLGAMGAQAAIVFVTNYHMTGVSSLFVAFLISIPMSVFLGLLTGKLFNRTKGQEMITGMILGFFAQGVYILIFLYLCGPVIPLQNQTLLLPNGIGLTTPINLDPTAAGALNRLWKVPLYDVLPALLAGYAVILFVSRWLHAKKLSKKLSWKEQGAIYASLAGVAIFYIACVALPSIKKAFMFTKISLVTGIIILLVCAVITFLAKTKLGSDISAVGQDRGIASAMGIHVDRIRIIAVIVSTILAALGQVIYIQEIGNFTTYTAHENVGTYAIAALLVGGASIKKANIEQAFLGAILFHTMFVVAPLAGKNLFGDAATGEYFRVFVCYAVIAIALALHAWKTEMAKKDQESPQRR
ncbi:MAG TPA: ABC transporter permease [Clostridia bacterium]|nr:ABC transporter permease [Clostridia bacterium]